MKVVVVEGRKEPQLLQAGDENDKRDPVSGSFVPLRGCIMVAGHYATLRWRRPDGEALWLVSGRQMPF